MVEFKVVLVISYPSIHEYVAVSSYLFPVISVGPTSVELRSNGGDSQEIPKNFKKSVKLDNLNWKL